MRIELEPFLFMIEALLYKLPINLQLALSAFVVGLGFAIIIVIIRFYRISFLLPVIELYLSIARGTPLYLQIVLCFLGLPILFKLAADELGLLFSVRDFPPMLSATVALVFYITAPLSEALRGGMSGIHKGEIEAAYSIGMTSLQVLRRVIIPQSCALCLPNFCVLFIGLTHSTTLTFGATIMEMNGQATLIADDRGFYFEAFIATALLFWLVTLALQKLFKWLEKRVLFKGRLSALSAPKNVV